MSRQIPVGDERVEDVQRPAVGGCCRPDFEPGAGHPVHPHASEDDRGEEQHLVREGAQSIPRSSAWIARNGAPFPTVARSSAGGRSGT